MGRLLRSGIMPAVLAAAVAAACHRPARGAPDPARMTEQYCWWTVWRTTRPPDSVAARFARAFTAVGLTGGARTRAADTAWAHAGPSPLDGAPAGAAYASRMVAYRLGDSTRFRVFIAFAPPPRGWADPADTASLSSRLIGTCDAIMRAASIGAQAPREPNGEETLDVWRRRRE